ncbi:hypothetical protein U9R90_03410 [Streptomyces sp. E11-3]|uniref:hypothetical protein n=1 Tax=Streptomyces sp. E11-3 TaxID=3110112 RepID=UPI0039816DBB
MTTRADGIEGYAHLWQAPAGRYRWVLWTTAEETMVFDKEINCPEGIDEPALSEVVRRMREAGVPETDAYPGRSCGQGRSDRL